MSRANEESATKSTRIKAAWLNKNKAAQEGKHIDVNCPAWLENIGTSYKLIPEKVAIIKRMTDLYLSGLGCLTISGILNKDKVPVISTAKKKKSATWHPYQIGRLLKNKALIGTYVFVDPEIPGFYPSAISNKTFFATQAKLNERPKYKGQRNLKPYLFSGLMKCKQCGGTLFRAIEKGYSYIECMNRKDKQGCTCAYQNYPATERAFLNAIAGIDSNATEPDEEILNVQKGLDALQGKLLELLGKIKAASDIFRKTPSDSVSLILQQFEVEKRELEQQISQKRNITFLHDHRRDWREVKATLEKQIRQEGSLLEVIPISLYKEDGKLKTIRHEDKADLSPIALRENIRSYIRDIIIDTDSMRSEIKFKSGKSVVVEMCKTNTRPIKYSYKVDGDTNWTPINL